MLNKAVIFTLFGWYLLSGCDKDTIPECDDTTSIYSFGHFPIGVALENQDLFAERSKEIAANQFNSITPENALKAERLHPEMGIFNWTEADSLVAFCTRNNQRIHGHCLVWHRQLPDWILHFQGSQAEWDSLLKNHVTTIVSHYKDQIKSWDVVNEAYDENGLLRESPWLQGVGPDYIEKAFRYANMADPDALLFYNDYNLESNPQKREAVIEALLPIKSIVQGVGFQMHIDLKKFRLNPYFRALNDFAKERFLVHLSELDISINANGKNETPSDAALQDQAILLGDIVDCYQEIPQALQFGITFWGISDKDSWLLSEYQRADYPLLYDENFQVKPAYCALVAHL